MGETGPRAPSLRRPVTLTRAVVRHAMEADVPFMAGAIAYQAFVSLLPLLFLLAVVTATLGDSVLTGYLLDVTAGQLPLEAQDLVRDAVRSAVDQTGNSIVGVVLLGFGAFAVFNGFDKAFTDIYGVERGGSLPNQIRDAAVVFTALAVALIAIAATWRVIVLPEWLPLRGILRPLALAFGLGLAFYPMYYVFPEVSLGWREVLPGVAVAAIGWTGLQMLYRFYVRFATRSRAFGVVGGIMLLAGWLYFSGFILLLGASLNAVIHDATDASGRSTNEE